MDAYLNTLPSSNSAGGQYSNIQYPHIQFPAASGGAAGAAGTGQVLFAAQSGDHISFLIYLTTHPCDQSVLFPICV